MKIDNKKSMIELGCGNGGNLKYLFKDFNQTTGVELDTFSFQTLLEES
jgi:16S rRNA A1518/A1519 N6-dimethyltransferase RsmA/KsgA/DIM1 with predicted DNA glycosylase/AP lyase activity